MYSKYRIRMTYRPALHRVDLTGSCRTRRRCPAAKLIMAVATLGAELENFSRRIVDMMSPVPYIGGMRIHKISVR